VELVLKKLQLHEILDNEEARLHTLKSENIAEVIGSKPESDTGRVSYGNYHLRHETVDRAEGTLISISLQSQSETNERNTSISSSCVPELDTLETSTICNTASKPPALPEKLNNTLSNIWKIKDKNTCDFVRQRGVTNRKVDDANKKIKRKSGLSSNSSKAPETASDIGTANLKKKAKMEEITEVTQRANIPSAGCNQMSDVGKSNEELTQSNSLKQRFLFTEDLPCKAADDSNYTQACSTVDNIMGEAPYSMLTSSSSKLSSCTFQKLQKFKRSTSNTDSVSQSIPEVKGSLTQTDESPDCKKDSIAKSINRQFEALNDLVHYGRKLSGSQQSSNIGSIPLKKTESKVSQNNPQVFGAGDDLEDLDFEI
jgi:hypothetical protein